MTKSPQFFKNVNLSYHDILSAGDSCDDFKHSDCRTEHFIWKCCWLHNRLVLWRRIKARAQRKFIN